LLRQIFNNVIWVFGRASLIFEILQHKH